MLLTGFFRVFLLYDVAEAFDLEKLRRLVGSRGVPAQRPFPRRTPEYVRFEQVPIVERAEPVKLSTGEEIICSIKYYAFAVVVVELQAPFRAIGARWSRSRRAGWTLRISSRTPGKPFDGISMQSGPL